MLYNESYWKRITIGAKASATIDKSYSIIILEYATSKSNAPGGAIIYWSNHSNSEPVIFGGAIDTEHISFSKDSNNDHIIANTHDWYIVCYYLTD